MSFIYWHPEGWMWQPAPNQTDGLARSTGVSASRTVSLDRHGVSFSLSLSPGSPWSVLSPVGSATLKKFISTWNSAQKRSCWTWAHHLLETAEGGRQHCQGCMDMGPESVMASEMSEQYGYREAMPIRPTRPCLQKLLIQFISPICSVLPPLNWDIAYMVRRLNNLRTISEASSSLWIGGPQKSLQPQ